jgi:uncharacterized heparinase superfamily protein
MSLVGRYWHTLRHLRPSQLSGRVLFRLHRPAADTRVAPRRRLQTGPWITPALRRVSLIGPRRFALLNEERDLDVVGWDSPQLEKLWRYNLHYFDDLNAIDAVARADWHASLIERWIQENPPGHGTGWEPYPTSLRTVNWIKSGLSRSGLSADEQQSLAVQARWLSRRLERHLLGNHLFVNAKALLFAACWFEGAEADAWRDTAALILAQQIPEQILADGGQFELSPMYHALAVEDVLDILNVMRAYPAARVASIEELLVSRIPAMLRWLGAMTHPDRTLALFNDTAEGVAPSVTELLRYAARLGFSDPGHASFEHLSASGYVRADVGDACLIADVAAVGPDYLPAHAHADTLSFELSLFDCRLVVNGGTSHYASGPARDAERGTAAHSTIVLNGADSSQVWGGFRVARRARVHHVRAERTSDAVVIAGEHDGYAHLAGSPRHHRHWTLKKDSLVVQDEITGKWRSAEARFLLHPDVGAIVTTPQSVELRTPVHRVVVNVEGGHARVENVAWHPEFGRSVPAQCLAVALDNRVLRTSFRWVLA